MSAEQNQLRQVRTFPALVKYLRDELDWPIDSEDFDDLTFEYEAEELGIDSKTAAKIQEIKQLRPLVTNQPWGIFFVKFEPKKLPVVALRRILGRLVVKKRASSNRADRASWELNDLLFISSYGKGEERQVSLAHFCESQHMGELPTLNVLGWDGQDTILKLDHVERQLKEKLLWPDADIGPDRWREQWGSAFTLRHREVVATSQRLAHCLAELATRIRHSVNAALEIETDKGPLKNLMLAFRAALIHDLSDDGFADMYAQTIAYGLLSARVSRRSGALVADDIAQMVPLTNPFLRELMETFLTVGGKKRKSREHDFDELGINDVVDLLRDANMEAALRDFGNRSPNEDPVVYFYEDFLKQYDAKRRIERGVFYTPQPVVSYIVRFIHDVLRKDFGLEDGLADTTTWGEMVDRCKSLTLPRNTDRNAPFVKILDPAAGTATFLVEVIEVVYETMVSKWKKQGLSDADREKAWNHYVTKDLLPRLYGYELMMAPYAIAHMKIGLKLWETGYRFVDEARVHVYLTDSLEPYQRLDKRFEFAVPALAHESSAVNNVKDKSVFTVVIGNPPYLREKERGPGRRLERIGGWVRFGDKDLRPKPIFDDFVDPLTDVGKGVHAKLAYELSVMFWRLMLWNVFERRQDVGVIGMISPRAYISGPGHYGMRNRMRDDADRIWVTDLGGDNRGARKSDNIFDIETGVSIAVCGKSPLSKKRECDVKFIEITGSADAKLKALEDSHAPLEMQWISCCQDKETFLPESSGDYYKWARLTDLFPWQHSGSQFKRLWPIGESESVLRERWKHLLQLPKKERRDAFVETRDRRAEAPPKGSKAKKFTGILELNANAQIPPISRYCYRSLDRQWCIADSRLADFIRPSLVSTLGDKQVFAATLTSKQLGDGPAVSVTSCLPDMDVFCNRGAKDVIPLWRDAEGAQANITPGLLSVLSNHLDFDVSPNHLFCYCVAALGSPFYAEAFSKELANPGPRIPITANAKLFGRTALLGARFVWLQTFGERWLSNEPNDWAKIRGRSTLEIKIPDDARSYPESFSYDAATEKLCVGSGAIANVSAEVFGYSMSGFQVVNSWLRYRMKERGGRAGRRGTRSVLDEIRPKRWVFTDELLQLLWVIEGCVSLWPELSATVREIMIEPQLSANVLPVPTKASRKEPEPMTDKGMLF